ncbi:hypothetical protein ABT160_38015 [Streptomyces sp. NPDC001941]|uniref:hypothetical protein n=1 Tax=Streptomyces sp. NPDC001941 TaxID=3154659 RepID=UPI00331AF406
MNKLVTTAVLVAGAGTLSAPAALAMSPHEAAATPAARVVASRVIDRSGGTISGTINGGTARLHVPEGAFAQPTEVRMTTADTSALDGGLGRAGYSGYRTLAAVGVKAYKSDGSSVRGKFAKPLELTVTGERLHQGQKAVQLNLTKPAEQRASFSEGSARLKVNGTPDLVIVAPAPATAAVSDGKPGGAAPHARAAHPPVAGTPIEGATKAHTGVPLTPELVGAGLALAAGTALLCGAVGGRGRRPGTVA